MTSCPQNKSNLEKKSSKSVHHWGGERPANGLGMSTKVVFAKSYITPADY